MKYDALTAPKWVSHCLDQPEPITWSEQLPCTCVTAFSSTNQFLERFWRYSEYVLSPTYQSAKPTDLKMIFLAFDDVSF